LAVVYYDEDVGDLGGSAGMAHEDVRRRKQREGSKSSQRRGALKAGGRAGISRGMRSNGRDVLDHALPVDKTAFPPPLGRRH